MGSSSINVAAASSVEEANSTSQLFADSSEDSNNNSNEMKNATEKSASQMSPLSSSRSVFSETNIIQLTCKRVTKEMNNTMWPFVIPLYIDNNDCLTVAIPHVNHNVLSPKIVSEICNNICGNPLGVKISSKRKVVMICLISSVLQQSMLF